MHDEEPQQLAIRGYFNDMIGSTKPHKVVAKVLQQLPGNTDSSVGYLMTDGTTTATVYLESDDGNPAQHAIPVDHYAEIVLQTDEPADMNALPAMMMSDFGANFDVAGFNALLKFMKEDPYFFGSEPQHNTLYSFVKQ